MDELLCQLQFFLGYQNILYLLFIYLFIFAKGDRPKYKITIMQKCIYTYTHKQSFLFPFQKY